MIAVVEELNHFYDYTIVHHLNGVNVVTSHLQLIIFHFSWNLRVLMWHYLRSSGNLLDDYNHFLYVDGVGIHHYTLLVRGILHMLRIWKATIIRLNQCYTSVVFQLVITLFKWNAVFLQSQNWRLCSLNFLDNHSYFSVGTWWQWHYDKVAFGLLYKFGQTET